MNKIAEFLSKWAFAIILCIIAVALLCAGICTIHTAIERPFVGIVGTGGMERIMVPPLQIARCESLNFLSNKVIPLQTALSVVNEG